jgi:hypothetical protein
MTNYQAILPITQTLKNIMNYSNHFIDKIVEIITDVTKKINSNKRVITEEI